MSNYQTEAAVGEREALDELIDCARLLGVTQAKKGYGEYTERDARFELAMRQAIARHRAALEARPAQGAARTPSTKHFASLLQMAAARAPTGVPDTEIWRCVAADMLEQLAQYGASHASAPTQEAATAEPVALAEVTESEPDAIEAHIRWLLNPLPVGSLLYDATHTETIERLTAERDAFKGAMHDEIAENLRLRELGGAKDDEHMVAFIERLIAERNAAQADQEARPAQEAAEPSTPEMAVLWQELRSPLTGPQFQEHVAAILKRFAPAAIKEPAPASGALPPLPEPGIGGEA